MRLICNAPGPDHRAELSGLLDGADEILISVAFLRSQGLEAIHSRLTACLKKGGSVRIHVGLDFQLTDPDALDRLADLARRWTACSVFVAGGTGSTFHPKAYLAAAAGKVRAMVGSANLTGGALKRNEELSIFFEGTRDEGVAAQLLAWAGAIEREGRVEPLSRLRLLTYREVWERARKARDRIEAEVAAVEPTINLRRLAQLLRSYKASTDFAQLAERRANRLLALKLQNEIAALEGQRLRRAEASLVGSHLRDLMGSRGHLHLWHSDAIFRQGSQALDHPAQIVGLFAAAKAAIKRSPEEAYESVRAHALDTPGVGVNMLTEVLSTFQPRRFPVFNGNTAGALEFLGLRPASLMSKQAFRGWHYQRVEDALAAVRDHIEADDFLSVDAFLNYVYFQPRP